jgi:hypothetical protein
MFLKLHGVTFQKTVTVTDLNIHYTSLITFFNFRSQHIFTALFVKYEIIVIA